MKMILRGSHPTVKKLDKIFSLADSLGISISQSRTGLVFIHDIDQNETFEMTDVDSELPITTFPPSTEYKLSYEK